MFVNKYFTYLTCAHLKKIKRCYNVNSSAYFCSYKDEDIGRFPICISVPLSVLEFFRLFSNNFKERKIQIERFLVFILLFIFIRSGLKKSIAKFLFLLDDFLRSFRGVFSSLIHLYPWSSTHPTYFLEWKRTII